MIKVFFTKALRINNYCILPVHYSQVSAKEETAALCESILSGFNETSHAKRDGLNVYCQPKRDTVAAGFQRYTDIFAMQGWGTKP